MKLSQRILQKHAPARTHAHVKCIQLQVHVDDVSVCCACNECICQRFTVFKAMTNCAIVCLQSVIVVVLPF